MPNFDLLQGFLNQDFLKWFAGFILTVIPVYLSIRSHLATEKKTVEDRQQHEREEFQKRVDDALERADKENSDLRDRFDKLFKDYLDMSIKQGKTDAENERLKSTIERLQNELDTLKKNLNQPTKS